MGLNAHIAFGAVALCSLSLAASGCGKKKQEIEAVRHDAALVGVATEAVALAASYGVTIDFSQLHLIVGTTASNVVAYCQTVTNDEDAEIKKRSAIVVGSNFMASTAAVQQSVLFHEYGHCGVGRSHENSITSGGIPISLMYAWTFSSAIYSSYTPYYIHELVRSPAATNYATP